MVGGEREGGREGGRKEGGSRERKGEGKKIAVLSHTMLIF